jgi:hypothetical protein
VTRINRISKNPVVPARVKQAFAFISDDPKATLQSAAEAVGVTTYYLRRIFKLPHVRAWIAQERRAQLTELIAGNPAALKDIRDKSENDMARLGSIKAAEALHAEFENPGRAPGQQSSPGLVVIIQGPAGSSVAIGQQPSVPQLELEPVEEPRRPLQWKP